MNVFREEQSNQNEMNLRLTLLLLGPLFLFTGCATYVPPAGRAELGAISSPSMQQSFSAVPAAQFPASIAAVRIQAPNYRSYSTRREGGAFHGKRFSVITTREVGEDTAFQRLTSLKEIGGFIPISRLLLPPNLESEVELRDAAARLKADMLLLYTFDTSFHNNDSSVALNVITLGLSPTRKIFTTVSASALLMDTRTGFIYAALETNENRELRTNVWESEQTADRARREAESAAFNALVNEFEQTWPRVVERARKGA